MNFYTRNEFRAYKSLESYNLFSYGSIGNVKRMRTDIDILLITGEVNILIYQLTNGSMKSIIGYFPHRLISVDR